MTLLDQTFNRLRAGRDKVSAFEYNRLAGLVEKISRSLISNGVMDSTGFTTRRPPISIPKIKVFEVQSTATGDGIYNCYEQTLDATEWIDTNGNDKFDDKNSISVEVLNLWENHISSNPVIALSSDDRIAAWQWKDDEGVTRWVGIPLVVDSDTSMKVFEAKAQVNAPHNDDLSVKLCDIYGDTTGSAFTVKCTIHNGLYLDEASPYIDSGKDIFVAQRGNGDWLCISPVFNACEIGCVCCS